MCLSLSLDNDITRLLTALDLAALGGTAAGRRIRLIKAVGVLTQIAVE